MEENIKVDDSSLVINTENESTQTEPKVSIAQQISNQLDTLKVDVNGKLVIPEDTDQMLAYALLAEHNRRALQSKLTKAANNNKKLSKEKDFLLEKVNSNLTSNLSKEQLEELEQLKETDPEAWYEARKALEATVKNKANKGLKEEMQKVSAQLSEEEVKAELKVREQILQEFCKEHPDFKTDYPALINETPPRLTEQLNKGEVDFSTFLNNVYNYFKKRAIQTSQPIPTTFDLSKLNGSSDTPSDELKSKDSYGKIII